MEWSKKKRWTIILAALLVSWCVKLLSMRAGITWIRPLSGIAALTVWLGIYMPRVQRSGDNKLIKIAWTGYILAMVVMGVGFLLPGYYGTLHSAALLIAAVFTIGTLLNQPIG